MEFQKRFPRSKLLILNERSGEEFLALQSDQDCKDFVAKVSSRGPLWLNPFPGSEFVTAGDNYQPEGDDVGLFNPEGINLSVGPSKPIDGFINLQCQFQHGTEAYLRKMITNRPYRV